MIPQSKLWVALIFLMTATWPLLGQRMYDNPTKLPPQSVTLSSNIVYNGHNQIDVLSLPSAAWGGRSVAVTVFLPRAYFDNPTDSFPVLYYTHGQGGHAGGFDGDAGSIPSSINNLINNGTIEPFIAVFPSGGPFQFVGTPEEFMFNELMPYIDSAYRTYAYPEQRAIMGFSMGGAVALRLGIKYKERFSSVCLFRSATFADSTNNNDLMRYEYSTTMPRFVQYPLPILAANGTLDLFEKRWSPDWAKNLYGLQFDTLVVPGCDHSDPCYFTTSGDTILNFMQTNFSPVVATWQGQSVVVSEDGTTGSFSLKLLKAPTANVTLQTQAPSGISLQPSSLTFSPTNWQTPQQVTVTALDNSTAQGPNRVAFRYSSSSADAAFNNKHTTYVDVLIHDDERPTTVAFARQPTPVNAPYQYSPGGYTIRENVAVDQFPPAYNHIQNFPKQNEIVLAAKINNPKPNMGQVAIDLLLTEGRLATSMPYSPNYATAADLQGYSPGMQITINPNDTVGYITLRPANDALTEQTEVAQFALGCATSALGSVALGQPRLSNIAIIDDEADSQTQTNIFITEVCHDAQGNVAIEVFNGNYRDLNLSTYQLKITRPNGPTTFTRKLISYAGGSFRAGEALVCGWAPSSSPLHQYIDFKSSALANVPVGSVIELIKNNSQIVDKIGLSSGSVPANGWQVEGVAGATQKTMIRKPTIKQGNPTFAAQSGSAAGASEWFVEPQGYFLNLGWHAYLNAQNLAQTNPVPLPCLPTAVYSQRPNATQAIRLFPNPATNTITLQAANSAHQIANWQIFDATGKQIDQRYNLNQPQCLIVVQGWPKGLYHLRYSLGNSTMWFEEHFLVN